MQNTLAIREQSHLAVQQADSPLTVQQVLEQVNLVQQVMRATMKEGEHFGKIPGCGDKPSLLQPGAQKLLLTFRFNPDYDVETIDMGKGHREYRVMCKLTNAAGVFIGSGVGSATTMESKWRFRVAPKQLTDRPVPSGYWDLRKSDPAKAQELLGGRGFSTKKNDAGQWMIAEGSSEKVEHDNPADYYNTCLKMAKKRALVDATLTRTAASDIFTQDVEEIAENMKVHSAEPEYIPPTTAAQSQQATPQPQPAAQPRPVTRRSEPVTLGNVTTANAKLIGFKERSGTNSTTNKPWKLWNCSFEDESGQTFEATTFDAKVAEKLEPLQGGKVQITYKPGKKPGTFDLVNIEPDDQLPM